MSTLKKVLALTLALAMVMSLGVFAAFKDQDQIDEDCTDAVELMNALGIILGDNNGNANPNNTITRAEAATMIFRLMNKGNDDASTYNGMKIFTDVPSGAWFEGYVNYCYTMGVVQGRTATTFDPYAPVTGMEIAKMLLTCLKYNAELEGYTGTNWAKNVLTDAQGADLLDGYSIAVTGPAQRQWVAYMFSQALKAEVVGTYFDGQIFSMSGKTLGDKQFGLAFATQYLVRVENTGVEASNVGSGAGEGYCKTVATNEDDASLGKLDYVADSNLLGQEVTVVYKTDSNGKVSKVYSIYATGASVVEECTLADVKYDSDDGYTVGNETLPGDDDAIVLSNANSIDTEAELQAQAKNRSTTTVKAIDQDGDDDFDVFIIVASEYDEFEIDKFGNVSYLSKDVDADDIADKINYVNTVEDENFVKVTANLFTGKDDIEALEASVLMFTRVYSNKYTLDGKAYYASADVNSGNYSDLTSANYGEDVTVCFDGGYIVCASTETVTTTSMPDKLALVIAVGQKEDAYGHVTTYVKLLTLDGKITEYEYYKSTSATGQDDVFSHKTDLENTIVQYVVNSNDTIYFKSDVSLPDDVTGDNTAAAKVDISKNIITDVSTRFNKTEKFFVYDEDADEYSVMTIGDFKADFDITTTSYMYTYAPSGKIPTYIAGFMYVGDMGSVSTDKALCYTTSAAYADYIDGDTYTVIDVVNVDGNAAQLILADDDVTGDEPYKNYEEDTAYWYTTVDNYATMAVFSDGDHYDSTNSDKPLTVVDGDEVMINSKVFTVDDDCNIIVKLVKSSGSVISVKYTDLDATLMDETNSYTYSSNAFLTVDKDDATVITNLYVVITRTAK